MIAHIKFADNSKFECTMEEGKRWSQAPANKKIKQVVFVLPDGNCLVLRAFELYNLLIEVTQDIRPIPKRKAEYLYAMGMKNNRVTSYRISLQEYPNSRHRIGDFTRREFEFGKEYNGGSVTGWKGVCNGTV